MLNCRGHKVKGEGHKVTRSGSTKTSNTSRKRYSVVEIHDAFDACLIKENSYFMTNH